MTAALTGISSMATRLILGELARRYEARTGVAVDIRSMGGVDAASLIRAGEAVDMVVLASNVMAQLEAEGHVRPGSVQGFTRSGMAIAVRAGAEQPDIGSEDAVRRAVLAATRVGYSTGPSGDHLLKLCARWGAPAGAEQLVKAPPGVPVGKLIADGEVELGFQQLSELIHAPAGPDRIPGLPGGRRDQARAGDGAGARARLTLSPRAPAAGRAGAGRRRSPRDW
jgi:molybdate transport system substrate-binding protein